MDRHRIRYMFEHRLLPQWFFEEKESFVAPILKDKGILFEVLDQIFRKENVDNPYSPEQFNIEAAKLTEEVLMVKITFPEPEEEPLPFTSPPWLFTACAQEASKRAVLSSSTETAAAAHT